MSATEEPARTAKDAWSDLLDSTNQLQAEVVVVLLTLMASTYTLNELNRAYLHRQRQIDRTKAENKVRAEGGIW